MKGVIMIFPKIKHSAVILSAIILSLFTIHGITPKNIDEQLLNLAYDKHEFSRREPFVLSPHQDMIAYCTIECNTNTKYVSDEIGTSAGKIGSQIYITNLNTKTSFKIGSPDANNWLPSWSPDNSKLAFFSDARGKPEVWIHDVKEKKSFPLSSLRIRSDFYSLSRSSWSPDGKFLYVQLVPEHYEAELKNTKHHEAPTKMVRVYESSKDQKNDVDTNNNDAQKIDYTANDSNLAVIDVSTHQLTILVQSTASLSPSFMKLSPSGNWLCFNSVPLVQKNFVNTVFDLFALNVKNHNKAQLIDKNLYNTYVPGFSLPYLWHPTEDKLVYIKDGKLFLLAFDNHGPLPAQQLGSANNVIALPFVFSEGGNNILIGASGNKFGGRFEIPRELLYISLDDGNTIKIPLHKQWLFGSIIKHDEYRIWQPVANTITFAVQDRSTNENVFVRISINNNKVIDERILWKGSSGISKLTPLHNNSLLCLYEDFDTPQNMYRITNDFDLSLKEQITTIDPRLDSLRGMTTDTFCTTITLPDGKTKNVHTTIVLPKKYKKTNTLPALVVFYPGSNYSSQSARSFAGGNALGIPNFLFLEAEYVLIFPDVTISAEGSSGNPLQEIVDILLPQIYHANQLGYINLDCLGIMGHSYGGYGTAGTIAKTSLFKTAVAISGLYDLPGNYGELGTDGGYFNRHWTESCQGRMGTHPWKDLQRYLNNSPYYLANNIKTPLLLIHGEKDDLNHIESEKMFSALQRLDKEAELAIYPGQGHVISMWGKTAAIDAYKRILEFLGKHLDCKSTQNCPPKMSMLQNKCDEQTNF